MHGSQVTWGSSPFHSVGKGEAQRRLHEEHFYGAGLEMAYILFHGLDNHMTILDPNWAGKCTLTGCLVRKERGMLICHISIVGTLRTRAVSFSSLRMAHGFCMRVCVENLPTIRTFLCCCRRVFFLLVRCSVRS